MSSNTAPTSTSAATAITMRMIVPPVAAKSSSDFVFSMTTWPLVSVVLVTFVVGAMTVCPPEANSAPLDMSMKLRCDAEASS